MRWTEQQITRMCELSADHTAREIASVLGCTEAAVQTKCFRLGIRLRGRAASTERMRATKAAERSRVKVGEMLAEWRQNARAVIEGERM